MKNQIIAALGVVVFACVCRVIPHLANFSPMVCIALFAGYFFDKRIAIGCVLATLLISDVALGAVFHYPPFGLWTLFTYSGFLAILALGMGAPSLEERFSLSLVTVLGSTLGFWVWTNLASWLAMYPKSISGLIACYTAGLPFLQYSLAGSVVWFVAIWALMHYTSVRSNLLSYNAV